MKTILTTLNSKYIHTSLALRWLYVANKDHFDVSFREYVIKEDVSKIADDLMSSDPDIIGIGIYIWNVDKSSELISTLKALKPKLIIIAGGPEVSYEPEHFLNCMQIDFIISGEGEFVLNQLLSALEKWYQGDNSSINIESVSYLNCINKTYAKADLGKLIGLSSPYMLDAGKEKPEMLEGQYSSINQEESYEDRNNRFVYFETSRGCPYQCGYCLSSLEKGVRYFNMKYILQNLEYLIKNNARRIKFLDRTFNIKKNHSLTIFDFLIEQYKPELSFQFEIYADLLDNDTIDYLNAKLPPHYFRFEVGIQSTYEPTNKAVKRKQDFERLTGNIRKLMVGGKIDLHLDLIAGLPYETFDRFKKSFNDVFSMQAKEVQLGFLKMLRGTSLRRNAKHYGYEYNENAPYEITHHNDITNKEIRRIRAAEYSLEKYWNSGKFVRTMQALFDTNYKNRFFELFDEIGQYYEDQKLSDHCYHLEDLFLNLYNFLISCDIHLFNILKEDYYSCFKIRPHGFWKNSIDKKTRKQLLHHIASDKELLKRYELNRKIIEKQTAIDQLKENEYLLTVFCDDGSRENPMFITYNTTNLIPTPLTPK